MSGVEETTIILCGGPINYANLPIGTNLSNAMISVNGKPVISWILDNLLEKGIRQATVVLRGEDHRLQQFLHWAYSRRMELSIAALAHPGTIVHSLEAGLRCRQPDGLVRIVLGDTLITDSYLSERDFVYVGSVTDSRRWCVVETDAEERVVDYVDKQDATNGSRQALAGYYHLLHGDYLKLCVERSVDAGDKELSDVLRRYGTTYPVVASPVQEWYDFGHIDNLVEARRRLLRSRYFNSLTINPVLNTITKVSDDTEKLRDELNWYLTLPDELKALTPRILSHREVDGHLEIVQEYYGYPTVAELYIYGELPSDTWTSILRHVLRIHQECRRYAGHLSTQELEAMYLVKTRRRLAALRCQDPFWQRMLDTDELVYNGRTLLNVDALWEAIELRAQALARCAPVCVIHGDFCFSNILFDINNQIIRLIDPRGSFGRKGIYGDARYDVAKLRHSACGFYDYIVADMFDIEGSAGEFTAQVHMNKTSQEVASVFDSLITEAGYDLNEIRFIEGLIFVSMVPLHHGHPERQQMMFLTGLSLLNRVLEDHVR